LGADEGKMALVFLLGGLLLEFELVLHILV